MSSTRYREQWVDGEVMRNVWKVPSQFNALYARKITNLISSHLISSLNLNLHLIWWCHIILLHHFPYLIFKKQQVIRPSSFCGSPKKLPSSSSRWLLSTLMCTMEMAPKLLHLGRVETSAGVSADFFRCLETACVFLKSCDLFTASFWLQRSTKKRAI